jgi:hypothetical protein
MLSDLGQLGLVGVGALCFICLVTGSLFPVMSIPIVWFACVYSANYVDKNAS